MPFEAYLKKGFLKRQNANFKQIEKQIFYESDPFGTLTEAENSLKAATELLPIIQQLIRKDNPQMHFDFEDKWVVID